MNGFHRHLWFGWAAGLGVVLGVLAGPGPARAERQPGMEGLVLAQAPDAEARPAGREGSSDVKQADWKGVVPGQTTRAQAESLLGQPASVLEADDGSTQLIYPPGEWLKFNRVILNSDGIVQQVALGKFNEEEAPRLSQLVAQHGAPEQLSDRSLRDPQARQQIYRFPEGVGLWIVADSETGRVFGANYYDPAHPPQIPLPKAPPLK